MKYKSGYKYQLAEIFVCMTGIKPDTSIIANMLALHETGRLTINSGYAWDGPSGPAIDTKNFMTPSLVHDALYQLMREGHLDWRVYRNDADKLLRKMCRERKMSWIRAWWVYHSLKIFGKSAAIPSGSRKIHLVI